MQFRNFGDSPVRVSTISLGCWIFGVDWWGHYTDADANRTCHYAYDRGITFFDTGDAYGNGRAESLLKPFIAEVGRGNVQVGSKFGYDFHTDPGEPGSHRERMQNFSPAFMRRSLEDSLRRLGADYLDLYMAHNIKLPQFRDDLFAELDKVQGEGKIRAWGVSLGPAIGWREEGFKAMLDHNAKAVQTVFNLFEQHPGREFCELAKSTRAGVLARVHDNSSILKDAIKPETTIGANDHRKFRDQAWKVYGMKKVELIRAMVQRYGLTVHEFACRWLLMDPALTSITGTLLNQKEIDEAVKAADAAPISQADMLQLARDYGDNWGLGAEASPCNIRSSTHPSGQVPSSYIPPPTVLA